jgi:hypothetical protein
MSQDILKQAQYDREDEETGLPEPSHRRCGDLRPQPLLRIDIGEERTDKILFGSNTNDLYELRIT